MKQLQIWKDNYIKLNVLLVISHENKESYFSNELNRQLLDLHSRFYEPMRIAIVGKFSSGKSTFLNALLSNDILPTGITAVTSKVNYIKYDDNIRLQVAFKDGREELYDINNISKFTDQRDNNDNDNVKYLTLFYPLEILKYITFIDTPGLDSNSSSDTNTTEEILESVDGIIWLTLVQPPATKTEKNVLEKVIKRYSSKSLCVINQKDTIDDEDELEEVIEYIEDEFSIYFSKFEAISAKQALEARGNSKRSLIENGFDKFTNDLNNQLKDMLNNKNLKNIKVEIDKHSKSLFENLISIKNSNVSKNNELLKESNINSVITFIDNNIKPSNNIAKEFAIKNEMIKITNNTINQNNILKGIIEDLVYTIYTYDIESTKKFMIL